MRACSIQSKIVKKEAQIAKVELQMRVKEDLKTVALGTSKINYMDPRCVPRCHAPARHACMHACACVLRRAVCAGACWKGGGAVGRALLQAALLPCRCNWHGQWQRG